MLAFAEDPAIAGHLEEHLGFADPLDFFDDFRAKWDEVRFPVGAGPLEAACERARAEPLALGAKGGPTYGLLISVAYHLQVAAGPTPVLLPVTRLANLLGKSAQFVSSLLKLGVQDGFLVIEDPKYSYRDHKARTFKVVTEKLGQIGRAHQRLH